MDGSDTKILESVSLPLGFDRLTNKGIVFAITVRHSVGHLASSHVVEQAQLEQACKQLHIL